MNTKHVIIGAVAGLLAAILSVIFLVPALQPAPDINIETLSGDQLNPAKTDQFLLVDFWATSCPTCVQEMPELAKFYQELNSKGLELVAVAMGFDSLNNVQNFAAKRNLPFHVAHDQQDLIAKGFGGVRVTPTFFLVNPEGKIVYKVLGHPDLKLIQEKVLTWNWSKSKE